MQLELDLLPKIRKKCILYNNKSHVQTYINMVFSCTKCSSRSVKRCTLARLWDQTPPCAKFFTFPRRFLRQNIHRLWAWTFRQTGLGIWQTALPHHRGSLRSFYVLYSLCSFHECSWFLYSRNKHNYSFMGLDRAMALEAVELPLFFQSPSDITPRDELVIILRYHRR